jgi:hypothetical protein
MAMVMPRLRRHLPSLSPEPKEIQEARRAHVSAMDVDQIAQVDGPAVVGRHPNVTDALRVLEFSRRIDRQVLAAHFQYTARGGDVPRRQHVAER